MEKASMKFIRTDSVETREQLLALGFTEIETQDKNVYTFMNNGKMTFDANTINCVYTNILNL